MKYWGIFLAAAIIILFAVLSFTPSKKLKCADDMCMILEKTFWHPKSRIKQYFFKSDVLDARIETKNNQDYLVITTKSSGDIYLKFLHTSKTAFKNKNELSIEMNRLFMRMVRSNKDYESDWQKDVGSIQIYAFGKPLFQ